MDEKKTKPHRFLWWLFGFVSAVVATAATVAFLPVKYYFGGDTKGNVSEDVANSGLLAILSNYQNYTIGDFPGLQSILNNAMKSQQLDSLFSIDFDTLNDVKITDNEIGTKVKTSIKITATLRSITQFIGRNDLLGPFTTLSVFQEWTPVEETPDPTSPSFNASLYYWQKEGKYVRAFNDDNTPLPEVVLGETPLFYPALYDVPVLDIPSVMQDRLGMAKVIDIVKAAGFGDETSTIGKIVRESTLSDLSSFSVDSILVSDLITPDETNDSLYRVLLSGCQTEDGSPLTKETLTVGNLKSMNVNQIKLADVVHETEENQKVIQMLTDGAGKSTYKEVVFGDLSKLDANKMKLSRFLTESEVNETMVSLFQEATAKDYSTITIGDLMNADFKDVKLSSFLKANETNHAALDAIASGCGKSSYEEVTIKDLDTWNGDKIKLETLFPESDNPDLYPLLRDLSRKETGDLYLSDLKELNPKKLHLKTVLPVTENHDLYDLLVDMVGDGSKAAEDLQLSDLSSIDVNRLHLIKVLPKNSTNENLFRILADATGSDASSLQVSDLNRFDSNNIHLSSVLAESENETLYQILSEALGKSDRSSITLGDLSSFEASQVKLSSVYALEGHESFYRLLSEATGKEAANILVGDLDSFDTAEIRLSSVLDPSANPKIYDILCEVTKGEDGSALSSTSIKIGDLSRFDPANIHLKTVLNDDGNNPILKALIAKDATVGNLAATLNALPLVDLYGDKCFQEEPGESDGWNADPYRRTLDTNGRYTYTLANGATPTTGDEYYYVAPNAGVWLLFCYDSTLPSDPSNAAPMTYTPSTLTLSDWEDGTTVSSAITKATLYEAYTSHLVSSSKAKNEYPSPVLRMTLGQIINAL